MIIPSKFNGFHGGVRRCFGGGGGGGGGGSTDVSAPAVVAPPSSPPTPYANMAVNTQQGYDTLAGQKNVPWGQSGNAYNSLLNQGFTSNQIRDSASSMYGAPSDANWGAMVQNAGMNSPTGRPMAGSDQFFQPVYNSQYQNYARPATQFDTSMYGTQPVQSPAFASGMSRGNINNAIGNYFQQNPNSAMSDTLNAMRSSGINRTDIQAFGGVNNYGPQMSMPQMSNPFNPYSNSSGYGGGFGGGYMPQMQTPFSYQQQSYQPQMQSPFSYQQQSYQPSYQSSYGGYGNGYDNSGYFTPMQPAPIPQRTSSGPSQAIVGRSSQMRGTPNVMRRAEGGIASLMDDVE
jgi:hypothetical protein